MWVGGGVESVPFGNGERADYTVKYHCCSGYFDFTCSGIH